MNPDDILNMPMSAVGTVVMDSGDYKIMTNSGLTTIGNGSSIGASSITMPVAQVASVFSMEAFLDQHIMNRVTVDHKLQEQELMKMRETAPDYANEIKEIIAKDLTRDVTKKISYTKKHDKNADVHHFIGRVWLFTEDELKTLIKEARSV